MSTGNFYENLESGKNNIDPLIELTLKFDMEAIEISTINKQSLHSSNISARSLKLIENANFKRIGYHFPIGKNILSYEKNKERIKKLLINLQIDVGIVHPFSIPNHAWGFDFPILLENVKSMNFNEFSSYYNAQKDLGNVGGICFDTSHAVHFDKSDITDFLKEHEPEIKQIHFGISSDGVDHLPYRYINTEFEDKISSIKKIFSKVECVIIEINYSKLPNEEILTDIKDIKQWMIGSNL